MRNTEENMCTLEESWLKEDKDKVEKCHGPLVFCNGRTEPFEFQALKFFAVSIFSLLHGWPELYLSGFVITNTYLLV